MHARQKLARTRKSSPLDRCRCDHLLLLSFACAVDLLVHASGTNRLLACARSTEASTASLEMGSTGADTTSSAARLLLGGAAVRATLVLLGAGEWLQWRTEVSTPANSLLSVREGLRLIELGVSPYSGSQCRTPPLLLALGQWTAGHPHLYALPNVIMDLATALMLRDVALASSASGSSGSGKGPPPGGGVRAARALARGTSWRPH